MIEPLTRHASVLLIDLTRLCLWLTILSAIFVPLERLLALHPRTIWRKDTGIDLGYYFLGGLLPALLLSVPLGIVAWAAARFVPYGLVKMTAEMPFWIRALASLVVAETGYYWGHRWMHAIPLLWRFHAVHHSAEHIDFLVNTRAHPGDLVFSRLCGAIPLYVLGLAGPAGVTGAAMPVLITLSGIVWGFFIHANLRLKFGPLAWIVSTPMFHHWHHATHPRDKNFASTLPWLDRIFGTYHAPKGQWPPSYGIAETIPASFGGQLVWPLTSPFSRPAPGQDMTTASAIGKTS